MGYNADYCSNVIIVIFKIEFDEGVWMWIIFKTFSPGKAIMEIFKKVFFNKMSIKNDDKYTDNHPKKISSSWI